MLTSILSIVFYCLCKWLYFTVGAKAMIASAGVLAAIIGTPFFTAIFAIIFFAHLLEMASEEFLHPVIHILLGLNSIFWTIIAPIILLVSGKSIF